jgi:hypothetical protein
MFDEATVLPHNLLQTNPLHSSQHFDTSLQKARGTISLCGPWAALHFLASIFWPPKETCVEKLWRMQGFVCKRLWGKTVVTLNMFFIRNKQLRAHIVKLCRALSEDLCRKVVTNARGSFARGCEAKRWSHWTCSSLGTIFQAIRINSVPDVKCFCNNKNLLRAQSMVWYFVSHPVCTFVLSIKLLC